MSEFTFTYTVGGEHGSPTTSNRMIVTADVDPPSSGLWKVRNELGKDQWVNVSRVSSIWRNDPVVADSPVIVGTVAEGTLATTSYPGIGHRRP